MYSSFIYMDYFSRYIYCLRTYIRSEFSLLVGKQTTFWRHIFQSRPFFVPERKYFFLLNPGGAGIKAFSPPR